MHDKTPTHRRLAEIGLRAGGKHGFALAGGHGLCELAEVIDAGFDRAVFEQMLRSIVRFDDEDFAEYGVTSAEVSALRKRVDAWRGQLSKGQDAPGH